MTHLSISKAWDEARVHLTRDGALLWPVALALMALPGILFQALALPADFMAKAQTNQLTAADAGPWLLWLIPVLVINSVGILAVTLLVLRSGLSVGEAIGQALRRFPVVFAAWLLAIVAPSLVLGFIIGLARAVSPGLAALLGIAAAVLAVVIFVRLLIVATPVTTAEPIGPVAVLRRSWALTRGHVWRLIGLLLITMLLWLVITIAVSAVAGIVVALVSGGQPGPNGQAVLTIVSGLLNAALSLVFYVVAARIYAQLAGTEASVPATA